MVFETIAIILAVSLVAAIGLWNHILAWAQDNLFPWLKIHLPTLEQSVRDAFNWFDQNVATPIRRSIKKAWENLRPYLLKAGVKFKRLPYNRWEKQWTAYLLIKETNNIVKQHITESVSWEDMPNDVREEALRRGVSEKELNVTKARDQEMQEVY